MLRVGGTDREILRTPTPRVSSEPSCQKGITRMSKKPTIGRSLCTLVARISFLIHCKFRGRNTQIETLFQFEEVAEEEIECAKLQHIYNTPKLDINSTMRMCGFFVSHSVSYVKSESTVSNYMLMTALGKGDVRNIIVGAETERLSEIIAVVVKVIIISPRRFFLFLRWVLFGRCS